MFMPGGEKETIRQDTPVVTEVHHLNSDEERHIRGLSNALTKRSVLSKLFNPGSDEELRDLTDTYHGDEGAVFVATSGGESVGMLALRREGSSITVDHVRLETFDPAVARKLLEAVYWYMSDHDCREVTIAVSEKQSEMLGFLQHEDFHEAASEGENRTLKRSL